MARESRMFGTVEIDGEVIEADDIAIHSNVAGTGGLGDTGYQVRIVVNRHRKVGPAPAASVRRARECIEMIAKGELADRPALRKLSDLRGELDADRDVIERTVSLIDLAERSVMKRAFPALGFEAADG